MERISKFHIYIQQFNEMNWSCYYCRFKLSKQQLLVLICHTSTSLFLKPSSTLSQEFI